MSEEEAGVVEAPVSEALLEKRATMANAFLCFLGAMLLLVVIPTIVLWPGIADNKNQTFQMFYTVNGLRIAGAILLAYGCGKYAKAKGYSPWIGLLGLVGIGFIVVLALYDRNQLPGEEDSQF